jgi:hypothetical protein
LWRTNEEDCLVCFDIWITALPFCRVSPAKKATDPGNLSTDVDSGIGAIGGFSASGGAAYLGEHHVPRLKGGKMME